MNAKGVTIKFESVREALSVPAFYLAYRELGDKYKLWEQSLDSLVDFFGSLSAKNQRRVLLAFGMRVMLVEDQARFSAGGSPGLFLLEVTVPPETREAEGARYVCPGCQSSVSADWLEGAGISLLASLYAPETVERIRKEVIKFIMVQPIDVSFPYSGKKHLHEADVERVLAETVLAAKLGLPEMVPPEQLKEGIARLSRELGFDVERWADIRARNIRLGLEPEPDFLGYPGEDGSDETEDETGRH